MLTRRFRCLENAAQGRAAFRENKIGGWRKPSALPAVNEMRAARCRRSRRPVSYSLGRWICPTRPNAISQGVFTGCLSASWDMLVSSKQNEVGAPLNFIVSEAGLALKQYALAIADYRRRSLLFNVLGEIAAGDKSFRPC